MCKRQIFYFLIGLTVIIQTVNANISGKVLNQAKNPIAHALLTLVKQQVKDTSGPDGSYLIATNTITVFPLLRPQSTRITLHRDFLEFNLFKPSPVKIEIFDVKGALLKKEQLPDAVAGFYHFNFAENARATKLIVIRASIGLDVVLLRSLSLKNGNYTPNPSAETSLPVSGKLEKIAVLDDTLKITADNYSAKAIPLTSYDQTLDVTLDTVGGGVTVQLGQMKQTIEGFGLNDTWAKEAFSSTVADALFNTTGSGIGLSILRVGMNSSGAFASSNISSDISAAKSRGAKIIGSCWSPPAGYKTGQSGGAGSENGGGHVLPGKYEAWATTIANFAKNNNLYAMSPQNEPDFASCGNSEPCSGDYATTLYTADEMAAFIKVAGKVFKSNAPGVKLIAPEASEWIHTWSDTSACCTENSHLNSSDPLKCGFPPTKCAQGKGYDYGHALYNDKDAWAALDILGVHEYDTQRAEAWPADVPDKKPVWQTEMCGTKWWPEQGPSTDINNGIVVAGWIHDALVKGEASAWLWWWYKSSSAGNSGLLLSDGTDTKRHWTLGNYSKFIRPGYSRVNITGDIPAGVLLSAYKGTDGTFVVVAIDSTSASATIPITLAGGTAPASLTPWVTSATDNLVSKAAVSVSGNTFTATLAGKTVTTFVGK
jgi:glucuronoarabinoxylan endo-1,4-beta-xylanase